MVVWSRLRLGIVEGDAAQPVFDFGLLESRRRDRLAGDEFALAFDVALGEIVLQLRLAQGEFVIIRLQRRDGLALGDPRAFPYRDIRDAPADLEGEIHRRDRIDAPDEAPRGQIPPFPPP